jgi:hypothetical protein
VDAVRQIDNINGTSFLTPYLGQVAFGSKLIVGSAGCVGICGRKNGLSDALWQA